MKLRANAKWHNKPPVNGRAADASDVVFSWNRYAASAPLRALAANSANPQAPVLSVTATDPQTISIKLKEPLVYALELFASFGSFTGNIVIMPKEVESGFDLRRDMIGTGPYMLSEYQPSIGFTLKRNPDYWDQNANFADQINLPIVIEYAQFLAQIKAGNILPLRPTNCARRTCSRSRATNRDCRSTRWTCRRRPSVMTFGQLPEGKSPFTDERVRQAFSMSWDRDAWIDAMFNVPAWRPAASPSTRAGTRHCRPTSASAAAGLTPRARTSGRTRSTTSTTSRKRRSCLQPRAYPSGLDVKSNRITTGVDCGPGPARRGHRGHGPAMPASATKVNDIDYATQYIPQVRDANGQYEGIGFHTVTGTTPWRMHPASALTSEYWSKAGATFKGFSTSGKNDKSGDPAVDSMIEKARLEKDATRGARRWCYDIQRLLGEVDVRPDQPGHRHQVLRGLAGRAQLPGLPPHRLVSLDALQRLAGPDQGALRLDAWAHCQNGVRGDQRCSVSKTTRFFAGLARARRWAICMRQYWIPAFMSGELPSPDSPAAARAHSRREPDRLSRHVRRSRPGR